MCYLCGCQFGSQSLFIHAANCQEKWLKKEANKPKNMRRPLPPPPAELEAGEVPTSHEGIESVIFCLFDCLLSFLWSPDFPGVGTQHSAPAPKEFQTCQILMDCYYKSLLLMSLLHCTCTYLLVPCFETDKTRPLLE